MRRLILLAGVLALALAPATRAATFTVPGEVLLVPLDVAIVAIGGQAVTALIAGHRTSGGYITNPATATVNLCVNEIFPASGTVSAGALECLVPGQTLVLTASRQPVSVVSADSAHAFAGVGWSE